MHQKRIKLTQKPPQMPCPITANLVRLAIAAACSDMQVSPRRICMPPSAWLALVGNLGYVLENLCVEAMIGWTGWVFMLNLIMVLPCKLYFLKYQKQRLGFTSFCTKFIHTIIVSISQGFCELTVHNRFYMSVISQLWYSLELFLKYSNILLFLGRIVRICLPHNKKPSM